MIVAAFLIALFIVLPALAVRYGKDSRVLDGPTGWAGAPRPRTP